MSDAFSNLNWNFIIRFKNNPIEKKEQDLVVDDVDTDVDDKDGDEMDITGQFFTTN